MYKPVEKNRLFNSEQRYDEINWNDFESVVDAFKKKLEDWYIEPIKRLEELPDSEHFGFPIMAMSCILIDTLSQFYNGKERGSKGIFKQFVRQKLPKFNKNLSPLIILSDCKKLKDTAEVLYHGFRCGILHQAHVPLYGAIKGSVTLEPKIRDDLTEYSSGDPCPTVVISSRRLFERVEEVFQDYIEELKNSSKTDEIYKNFKKKFELCFGVEITR